MKSLLLIAALLSASQVMARTTILNADFGALGEEGKSVPTRSSNKQAREIFNVLAVAEASGEKEVVAKEGRFTCTRQAQHNKFSCNLFVNPNALEGRITEFDGKKSVSFKGQLAKELWSSMVTITTQPRMGAIVKQAGNLTCSMSARPGMGVMNVCTLSNVRAGMYTLDDMGGPR